MVIIATDSAADFELDELKEMNITCLPMSVSFGENTYLENISITKDEFFERIEVDKKGHMRDWPEYFFDQEERDLDIIV